MQYEVCSVQCAVCSVQCSVSCGQCAVCRFVFLRLTKWDMFCEIKKKYVSLENVIPLILVK